MTERFFLLGADVSRSPTPAMMSAAFEAQGIDATYAPLSIKPSELESEFESLSESGLRGANVTIPFKSSIVWLLDSLDESASGIGAVNTIKSSGSRHRGYNTDVDGVVTPLVARGLSVVRRAAVLGTGGSARAFLGAMNQLGCRDVLVIQRPGSDTREFFSSMGKAFPGTDLVHASIGSLPAWDPDLFFNASPAGSAGVPLPGGLEAILSCRPTVFDAVYSPVQTELVRLAAGMGCHVIPGHEMLLSQAARAFQIWFNVRPPVDVMRRVLLAALGVHQN